MSDSFVAWQFHGGMFPGRALKTNNIVTRDTAVKEAVEAAALSAQGRDRRLPSVAGVVVRRKIVNKSKQWLFRDVGSGSIKPIEMWGRLRGGKFTTRKYSSSISQSSENQLPL
jgi:hypothetical protein